MPAIDEYLTTCIQQGASDLHLASEAPIYIRSLGKLKPISQQATPAQRCQEIIAEILTPESAQQLKEKWEVDTSYQMANGERFRVNIFRQRKGWDAVFRHFSSRIRTIDELGLPPILKKFADANQGLILITGPGRCGKSTTCAALVDYLNTHSDEHIITVEDPIEYVHQKKKCLVNQRSVGPHTQTFAAALRSALREDPDIIVVGEMRDYETMNLALTAAETGHLVIGTLHTSSAVATIARVINIFPAAEQAQATTSLAESLIGILSQRLIPNKELTQLVPAFEILVNTHALANVIREGEHHKIQSLLATGQKDGMLTMEACLRGLVSAGKISQAQADEILAEEA